jgi:hypothetical protein
MDGAGEWEGSMVEFSRKIRSTWGVSTFADHIVMALEKTGLGRDAILKQVVSVTDK